MPNVDIKEKGINGSGIQYLWSLIKKNFLGKDSNGNIEINDTIKFSEGIVKWSKEDGNFYLIDNSSNLFILDPKAKQIKFVGDIYSDTDKKLATEKYVNDRLTWISW